MVDVSAATLAERFGDNNRQTDGRNEQEDNASFHTSAIVE